MKHPSEDHDLIRWLDAEMNDTERAEYEQRLTHNPVLAKEAQKMRALSASLREHLPAEIRLPHGDYFNTQIEVRITQMALDDARAKNASFRRVGILQWLSQPWLALAGAAALAVLGFAFFQPGMASHSQSMILSSYTPNVRVQARTYHDSAAQATVLMLDGLDAIPADKKITATKAAGHENEPELAESDLFDTTGAAGLISSGDVLGNP